MTGQQRFLNRMIIFVIAVAALVAGLIEPLMRAFLANPALNGVIAAVLVLGIVYSFRQVLMLRPEIDWLKAYRRGEAAVPERAPRLLGPVAAMLGESESDAPVRMTAMSMRSLLDGVASRLEEGREISRYLTRLLIFLGLLGTFWGLLSVLAAIGETIQSLSVESTELTVMFDALKQGLAQPLDGMAIAFSSSLFGLAGSVVLGFLELQAGQAQNRFYNDLEDWLSTVARVTRSGPVMGGGEDEAAGSTSAYLSALLEQTADSLDGLRRTIESTESSRTEANNALTQLSESLAGLTDQMRAEQGLSKQRTELQEASRKLLERIAEQSEAAPRAEAGLDEASREHLRNLDVNLKRLIDEQAKTTSAAAEGLRSELKLVARTLSTALEQRRPGPAAGRSGRGEDDPS